MPKIISNLPLLAHHLKLCLVTHIVDQPIDAYLAFVARAVRGGVTMVQLREKSTHLSEVRARAEGLQRLLRPLGVPLIINDFVALAAEIGADGVHIGGQDMSPCEARRILGPGKIIGRSLESMEELEHSNGLTSVDYVTASAVFSSKTKPNCKTIWGIEGLAKVVAHSRHPVTAIGGITARNAGAVAAAGAKGIAVIGAIHDAAMPDVAARLLIQKMGQKVEFKYSEMGRAC